MECRRTIRANMITISILLHLHGTCKSRSLTKNVFFTHSLFVMARLFDAYSTILITFLHLQC